MPYTIENFHFVAIGCLQGAQDAPDLILAVGFAGSGLGS